MIFDSETLARCVSCGLCLPACPTFQVTHAEQHGPRGRIAGMRMLQSGEIDVCDPAWIESMETCVQCRACEPACPSGVQFGALIERARATIHERERTMGIAGGEHARPHHRFVDGLLGVFASRAALRVATVLLALAQFLHLDRLAPARWRVAHRVRLREALRPLSPTNGARPAVLFRGCVMDAWFRPVHRATVRVLAAAGYAVRTASGPACCGALHLHAGRVDDAKRLARRVIDAYADTKGVVVVNSAGCGAAMREYGRLLGSPEAYAFGARVRDFAEAVIQAEPPPFRPVDRTVMMQMACHLKNVQRVDAASEQLLRSIPSLRVLRSADGEPCCGAGGAYSLFQPEFAGRMREGRRQALMQSGVTAVVSGNPGCMLHLAAAGVPMVHIAELAASALPNTAKDSKRSVQTSRSS